MQKDIQIEFTADDCSYFPGRPSKAGFLGPFIGAGENETEAYDDAVNMAAESDVDVSALPDTYGKAENDVNAYMGEPEEELEDGEGTECFVYCILYLPFPAIDHNIIKA